MESFLHLFLFYLLFRGAEAQTCPSGSLQVNNESTCVYPQNAPPQKFLDISKQCANIASWAYPMRIKNSFENNYLKGLIPTKFNSAAPYLSIWKQIGHNWTYYDGTSITYWNWAQGEPSELSTANKDVCAIMNPSTGYWHSSECILARPYFCSVEIFSSQCLPGWLYNSNTDYCYFIQNFTMQGQLWQTWDPFATEPACQAMSPYSHLVSIHSKAEDDYVYSLAKTYNFALTPSAYAPGNDPCHYQGVSIGIYGAAQVGQPWTDGTRIDYLGTMDSPGSVANWMLQNDDSCHEKQWHAHGQSLIWCRFVCKMPSNNRLYGSTPSFK